MNQARVNAGPAATLRAAVKIIYGDEGIAFEDLPEELRDELQRLLTINQPQEAIDKLDRWAKRRIHEAQRLERSLRHAASFRKARRAHGVPKVQPRWQRGVHRPRSIESAMADPRVRGQLAGV